MNGKLTFKNLVEISSWPCESFNLSNLIIFSISKAVVGFHLIFACVDL